MVFWRSRSEKKAEASSIVAAEQSVAPVAKSASSEVQREAPTNVVTLVTNRLADRLADIAVAEPDSSTAITTAEQSHFFGQKRAAAKIRAAFSTHRQGEHLVVLGEPGTGRLELAQALATDVSREPAPDFIYVVEPHAPTRAKAFALPGGEGRLFLRDVQAAIAKASAAFERQIKSEEHRISLDLLEEEMRHRGENAVDQVRRRAEAQNIAVVKSLDGYVLAPMHEGRVVRSDVFRALPEALKRNVETKITALEGELQSIVATLPDVEFDASEKHQVLIRQTALRAVRPGLSAIKRSCAGSAPALAALEAIEEAFLAAAIASPASMPFAPVTIVDCDIDEADEVSPVIVARNVSPPALLGEIGRDARGRPTLLPGHLMRAGSGFVIIEAWRLAADPQAWLALSAAIAANEIIPVSGSGAAVKADPVPLNATIVVIADAQSWSKLDAIEPGVARHFPHVAKLAASVPIADLGEPEFMHGAARLAANHGLKPLSPAAAPLLYKDAVRRGGGGRVSLAGIALLHLMRDANAIAAGHSAAEIRASDVTEALAHRADCDTP